MKYIEHNNDLSQLSTNPRKLEHFPMYEYESGKLGQELHDGVNPLICAALLYNQMLKPISKKGIKIKETVHTILLEAAAYIRNLASNLVSLEAEEKDLRLLVEKHVELIKKVVRFSIKVDFENTDILSSLSDEEILNLYRIVQEQINNIIKYSEAKNVRIQFRTDEQGIYLRIQDDGIGFDTNQKKNGIGLCNMKKRIEQLNGKLHIDSSPGNGCIIHIKLPPH